MCYLRIKRLTSTYYIKTIIVKSTAGLITFSLLLLWLELLKTMTLKKRSVNVLVIAIESYVSRQISLAVFSFL